MILLYAFLSLALHLWSAATQPTEAICLPRHHRSRGNFINGVQPSGLFRCYLDMDRTNLEYTSRIYCGSMSPLNLDGIHIGCRAVSK